MGFPRAGHARGRRSAFRHGPARSRAPPRTGSASRCRPMRCSRRCCWTSRAPTRRPRCWGRAKIEPAGQPPFRFEIAYDDALVQPRRRYVVRATVSHRDRLLFTTDRVYPVLDGRATPLQLLLVVRARPAGRRRDGRTSARCRHRTRASCPGADGLVAWHLDLLPAGRYQLRATHVGKPEPNRFDDIGRWMREHDTGWIVLRGQREYAHPPRAGRWRNRAPDARRRRQAHHARPRRPVAGASRRPRRSSRAWRSRACSRTWPTPPASPCAPTASGCRWPWTPTTERSRPHISRRARGRASPSSRASRD